MNYKSVDEINKFRFDDCRINSVKKTDKDIYIEVEALIVCADNSQNSNYTESYAGTAVIKFVSSDIKKCIRDGYKYYDANEVLISEVEDCILEKDEIPAFLNSCEGAYLCELKKNTSETDSYDLGIEFEDSEDGTVSDSYSLVIVCEKIIVEWDQYLNRVQKL